MNYVVNNIHTNFPLRTTNRPIWESDHLNVKNVQSRLLGNIYWLVTKGCIPKNSHLNVIAVRTQLQIEATLKIQFFAVLAMADVNVVFDYDIYQHERAANNAPRRRPVRGDPRETMTPHEIFNNFRFRSENIDKIVDLLRYSASNQIKKIVST